MPLRQVLQIVQQAPGARCLRIVADPDFRQTLMRRQLTNAAAEVLPLHRGLDAIGGEELGVLLDELTREAGPVPPDLRAVIARARASWSGSGRISSGCTAAAISGATVIAAASRRARTAADSGVTRRGPRPAGRRGGPGRRRGSAGRSG